MKSKYLKPLPPTKYRPDSKQVGVVGIGAGDSIPAALTLIRPQAQTLVAKFGGPRELSRILEQCSDDPKDHIDPSTIYRWMYPKDKGGTGGEIPLQSLRLILKCARLAGVMLKSADIYPELVGEVFHAELNEPPDELDLKGALNGEVATKKDDK